MKLFSILKATMTGEMNIFRFQKNKKSNAIGKCRNVILVIFLMSILMFSVGEYAYLIAEPLNGIGLTYVMLSLFIVVSSVVVFMEGLYKAQGILFESKDNDLLLSMPIKKSTILLSRIIKLVTFQYIFDLIIAIPAFAVYAYFENPSISFYLISFLMILLIPIIPTMLACIIGYFIKAISSMFKSKKVLQMILTLAFTMGIFLVSFNTQNFINDIAQNATSINDIIISVYYPVGLFINCIQEFRIIDLILLIGINIIPAIVYLLLFSVYYFKIISKSSEVSSKSRYDLKNSNFTGNSQLNALVKKEIKRYFSSPIYVMNTFFGILIVVIVSIAFSFKFNDSLNFVLQGEYMEISTIKTYFPKIYMAILLFSISTMTITASSISLEGKGLELTKSLPVSSKKIFLSKILLSDIVCIPLLSVSTLLLSYKGNFEIIDLLICLGICIIVPNMIAIFGLIINLKFPLLNAKNDTVIVKQSMSSLVALFGGMAICLIPVILYFVLEISININNYCLCILGTYIIIVIALWNILLKYGSKRFARLNN